MHVELERVRSLLSSALNRPKEERLSYIREVCSADSALREEVESLLNAHEEAEGFLSKSLPELVGEQPRIRQELASGTLVKSRYRISHVLSRSGFATVYLASDHEIDGRTVVVKNLDLSCTDEALNEVYTAELRSLGRLTHPNIVSISDAGRLPENGTPYLVLSYIPGQTLRELLRRGPLSLVRATRILQGTASALMFAHEHGIWHLDVKPENVIVSEPATARERVTVIDFGIARFRQFSDCRPQAGSFRYMSPEQPLSPTAQSDIYSLALVTFEMLTGALPHASRPVAAQLPSTCPRRVAQVLTTALATRPAERFGSPEEFSEAFERALRPSPFGKKVVLTGLLAASISSLVGVSFLHRPFAFYSRPVPFATAAGDEHSPAFCPDGQTLYYASGIYGAHGLVSKSLTQTEPVRMARTSNSDDFPQCSPDGRSIAFLRDFRPGTGIILQHISPPGKQVELLRGRDFDTVSWSADGSALVVGAFDPEKELYHLRVLDIKTRAFRDWWEPQAGSKGDHHPAASPDGRFVAFVREWRDGNVELMVVEIGPDLLPKARPRSLVKTRERKYSIQWTPDSRDLVYVSGSLSEGSIWRVSREGGPPEPVLPAAQRVERISIPRNSWKLAYGLHYSDSNIWRYELGALRPDVLSPLITGTYGDDDPRWSPDRKHISFASARTGGEQIWVVDSDGKNLRQITHFDSVDAIDSRWTRDSKELILSVRSNETGIRVFRIAVDAFERHPSEVMNDAFATSMSRDGRNFYFRSLRSGTWQIWRASLQEGVPPVQITSEGAYEAIESHDGRSLYFTKRHENEGIWIKPLNGGPSRRIVDRLYRRNLFTSSRGGLYYIAAESSDVSRQSLYFWDEKTQRSKRLHTFERQISWGLDLSPDENSLLFSQYDVDNIDIMVVDAFR